MVTAEQARKQAVRTASQKRKAEADKEKRRKAEIKKRVRSDFPKELAEVLKEIKEAAASGHYTCQVFNIWGGFGDYDDYGYLMKEKLTKALEKRGFTVKYGESHGPHVIDFQGPSDEAWLSVSWEKK